MRLAFVGSRTILCLDALSKFFIDFDGIATTIVKTTIAAATYYAFPVYYAYPHPYAYIKNVEEKIMGYSTKA